MKALIVEDDAVSAHLYSSVLRKAGYKIDVAEDGSKAVERLGSNEYDAIVTDWLMPNLDGLGLIRHVRTRLALPPLIVMITSLTSPEARKKALESGADEFIAKPVKAQELIALLDRGLLRRSQTFLAAPEFGTEPPTSPAAAKRPVVIQPPFVGVGIGASTGGPQALRALVESTRFPPSATYFVVLHGPHWMQESCAELIQEQTQLHVEVATDGVMPKPGCMYFAPGERHLKIDPRSLRLRLDNGPHENHVKPAIDVTFRDMAKAFGPYGIGVVLTGLGKDGAKGSREMSKAGGAIFVEQPKNAIAPYMPEATIGMVGSKCIIHPVSQLGRYVSLKVNDFARKLSVLNKARE